MKSSSRFRQLRLMLAIALVLLAPVAVVYINYVGEQKTFFTSRGFRQLGVISRQISSRIDTLKSILSSIVTTVDSYTENSADENRVDPGLRADQVEKKASEVADKGPPPRLRLTARPAVTEAKDSEIAPPRFGVRINEHGSPVRVHIEYDCKPAGSKYHYHLEASTSIDEVAGQYLETPGQDEGPEFDQVVIALRSSGVVLFQNGKPGLSATNLARMAGVAGSGDKESSVDLSSIDGYTALRDVTVAGQGYKLFIEPFGSLLNADGKPDQLIVCGLIQAARFDQAASAVPPIVLMIVFFLFLALTLSWPFIQLGLMGPGNRLRIYDVVFAAFSTVVGAGLLTLVVLDVYAYVRVQRGQDGQLRRLSDDILASLKSELADAVVEMDNLSSSEQVSDKIGELSRQDQIHRPPPRQHFDRTSVFAESQDGWIEGLRKSFGGYPYFDTVFWADRDGWQRIKLTADSYVSPLIRIKDRDYFQKSLSGDGWQLGDSRALAFVDSVTAANSGKSLAVVAKKAGSAGWVSVLGARLTSVMETAIPDGVGFCVINQDGEVVFHSDERRNRQENVFEECDESGELRSIVKGGSETYLDTRYVGRSHRLYVRPLSPLPWSLVVFRDKAILTGANFDLLTVSVSLLFIHCIILVIVLYMVCPLHSKSRSSWIWPYLDNPRKYLVLIAVNLGLSTILYAIILASDGWFLLVPALIIPAIGTLTGYLIVAERWRRPSSDVSTGKNRLTGFRESLRRRAVISVNRLERLVGRFDPIFNAKRGYVFGGATAVLLLAVLPAMAWFKLAHNRQVELLVRFDQVSFVKRLNRRSNSFDQRRSVTGAPLSSSPSRGNYYSAFFTSQPSDYALPQPTSPNSLTSVESLLGWLYPHFNHGLYFRGLQDHFSTTDSAVPGTVNLKFATIDEKTSNQIELESPVPLVGWPGDVPGKISWAAGSLLLPCLMLIGLYLVVRTISRRVFLIDLREDRRPVPVLNSLEAFEKLGENLLVLAGPAAKDLSLVGRSEVIRGVDWRPDDWRSAGRYDDPAAGDAKSIVIDNFDYKLDDAGANKDKVDFLRYLWARGIRTIVISRVNPVYFAIDANTPDEGGRGAGGSQITTTHRRVPPAEYWEGVFSSSLKVHLEPVDGIAADLPQQAPAPKAMAAAPGSAAAGPYVQQMGPRADGDSSDSSLSQETTTLTSDSIETAALTLENAPASGPAPARWLARVGVPGAEAILHASVDSADANYKSILNYKSIWASLSRMERVTLFYICHDRFVSCKSRPVQDLLRRGLIKRDPALCAMSPTFRRFVISAIKPEEIYTDEAGVSPWNALRAPMMAALALVLTFLFYTQRSILDSGLALAAALTVAIPAILRLVSIIQRGKPATTPEPGDPKD